MLKPSPTLKDRSFIFFILTQYFGAFNDNIFKQLLLLMVVTGQDTQGIVTMVFSLPFLIFAGIAGQLSERFPKTAIMRLSKIAELAIMAMGLVGFYFQNELFLLFTLFFMGTQSTFFGPAKYGAIPELVENRLLVSANGLVQMTTFAAIILGIALASWLKEYFETALYLASFACIVVAVLGIGCVYFIQPRPANVPEMVLLKNPFSRTITVLREMCADKPLLLALIANTFFFFSGGMVTQVVNNYGTYLLHLSPSRIGLLLVSLVFGIMVGCLATAPVRNRIGGKWTIFAGAVGVAASEFMLFFYTIPLGFIYGFLFTAGFFTGLYFVPIAAFMQSRPPLGKKGEVLAAVNFCSFVGILLSGLVWHGLVSVGIAANVAWLLLSGGLVILLAIMFPQLQKID